MKCPNCDTMGETFVTDTSQDGQGGIRRRRECRHCGYRFSTQELPILSTPLIVKTNGERQEFDREKLIRGIRVACAKRPVSISNIHQLVNNIEHHLQSLGKDEVPSQIIGDMTVDGLKQLDPIAYIRYAIVYLGLSNLESVRDETEKLLKEQSQLPKPSA